jgi:NitT/TauT family transport system permease protein
MAAPSTSLGRSGSPWVTALFFIALGLAWEGGVRLTGTKAYLVPSLSDIAVSAWAARDALAQNGLVTLGEVLLGFGLAVLVGAISAVAVFCLPAARSTLYPLLVALQSIPKVGLAPLIVLWLGYGLGSKVLMAFLFAFFPIVITTLGGLANVPANLEEHFRALGSSRWTTFMRLQAPAALPSFVDGCKVAMPLAVIGAIVGEFVGSSDGLGNLIMLSTSASRTALTFAALLAVTGLSLALFYLVEMLGRLVWWRSN